MLCPLPVFGHVGLIQWLSHYIHAPDNLEVWGVPPQL
jgi:hypothetical protein